jgi:hypothetical protein
MTFNKSVQMGLLTLCLTVPVFAAPWRHHTRDTQVVDVNAHAIPPGPPHAKHVVVVNSAENAPRHHGIAGAFQRLHKFHMRARARLYRDMFAK